MIWAMDRVLPLHQHGLGSGRETLFPKTTWGTKLNVSQLCALVAKRDMKVAKYWNELPREDVKYQFLQVIKTQLCKNLSNLM